MRGLTAIAATDGVSLPEIRALNTTAQNARPEARGKFLFHGGEKFHVRGVTYGTFASDANGNERWEHAVVARDFAAMADNGFNAVRVYTTPPKWFLDLALKHGLLVMVGLAWEQHIDFLNSSARQKAIEKRIRARVAECQGHPAILCFAIGNEIPAQVVRWHGQRNVERFLDRIAQGVKREDPNALVTYVNYPSTEYLRLNEVDLTAFNVYLEHQAPFERYLARLHNLADGRPLLMTEMGLDSRRHGADTQARVLDWQVRTAMASGCAGAFVFAWTDEWHRGGEPVQDWDFGLTTRDRQPKPALATVREAFGEAPFANQASWPPVSVVVCTHNGGRTLGECLQGLEALDYPDFEIIVVDDGSADGSAAIAARHQCRLIRTPNRGLSNARNTGWKAARGEIVAYIDDDAYPDPHWLRYLVQSFQRTQHAAVGGPNLPPGSTSLVADCIASAPGGPTHVLLSDEVAEHIPGCNMAFRKTCLKKLEGFDPQFRVAGDDVDICWRIQERGWTIGFSPAALVWHHRRSRVSEYWNQQKGYGKAEALLERKWPEKYNAAGHVTWSGRVYGKTPLELFACSRVYHGVWGCAAFQRVYQSGPMSVAGIAALQEWWLLIGAFGALGALGILWRPLLWSGMLAVLAFGVLLVQAIWNVRRLSRFQNESATRSGSRFLISIGLHLLQPLARLVGRLRHGLTAWRWAGPREALLPTWRSSSLWSEAWQSPQEWLTRLQRHLAESRCAAAKGGAFDRWDLEVRGGLMGAARSLLLVEEHGQGKQFLKLRSWPRWRASGFCPVLLFSFLGAMAVRDNSSTAGAVLFAVALWLLFRIARECAWAQAALKGALQRLDEEVAAAQQRNGSSNA